MYSFFACIAMQSALMLVIDDTWNAEVMNAALSIRKGAAIMADESIQAAKPGEAGLPDFSCLTNYYHGENVATAWTRVRSILGLPNPRGEEFSPEAIKAFGECVSESRIVEATPGSTNVPVNVVYTTFPGGIEEQGPVKSVFKFFNNALSTYLGS